MKVVIDIPEKHFLDCKYWLNEGVAQWAEAIIANGTPLPKGHGRLIDADALPLNDIDDANYGSNYIKIAPTIIEADKSESEK